MLYVPNPVPPIHCTLPYVCHMEQPPLTAWSMVMEVTECECEMVVRVKVQVRVRL